MSDLIIEKEQIEKLLDAIELGKEAMYRQIEEDLSFLRRSIVEYMGMPPHRCELKQKFKKKDSLYFLFGVNYFCTNIYEKEIIMNLPSYSTKLNKKLQQLSQTWEQEILSHLPENLDSMAQNSGIIKRKRGISSAIQLLKILFLYAASDISFRLLAAVAYGLGISDISDTAWRKKYRKATPFLQDVLQQLLSSLFPPSGITPKRKQVLLVDASLIRQQGKQQYQQRIHTCYSLNQNRIQQIQVTDYHTAESFRMFSFQKEDLILADAGYGKAGNYAYAMEQGCDVILRISPNHISLLTVEEEKLDIYTYLKEAIKKKEKTVEWFGFCMYEKKRYPIRLIAQELPKEQAEKARKRKEKKAQKLQSNIKETTLFYGNYVILITSLGVEYDREEILSIYRSRWNIIPISVLCS